MPNYEFRKIFKKRTTKIVFLIVFVLIALTIRAEFKGVQIYDKYGHNLSAMSAINEIKTSTKPLDGALTEDKLYNVLQHYKKIMADNTNFTDGYMNSKGNILLDKYSSIRYIISDSYTDNMENDVLIHLTKTDIQKFYPRYKKLLTKKIIEQSGSSIKAEAYKIASKVHTPFNYGYSRGWSSFLDKFSDIDLLVLIALAICLVTVFTEDIFYNTYDLICTTKCGYKKIAKLKIKAVVRFITIFYFICLVSSLFMFLFLFGVDGWKNSIQIRYLFSSSSYNFLGTSILMLISGYIGAMLIGAISVFLSSVFKKSYISIFVLFIFILAPYFYGAMPNLSNGDIVNKIIHLFPIVSTSMVIENNSYVNIFGINVWSVFINLALTSVITFILFKLSIKASKRKESRG